MSLRDQLRRTAPAVVAGAVVGSLGTKPTSAWYRGLDRPSWEPPPVAFPAAWTTLYVLTAWSSARAMERMSPRERRRMLRALWVNMGLNAGWCWLFFTAQKPWPSLAELALLEASTLDLLRRAGAADPTAAAGFAPYAAWNGFAFALNAEIARRNS